MRDGSKIDWALGFTERIGDDEEFSNKEIMDDVFLACLRLKLEVIEFFALEIHGTSSL